MIHRLSRISLVLVAFGCGEHRHDHAGGEGDHGHGESDYPAESVTLWTDKAELFMEWDALTVGRESSFLAHMTDMTDAAAFKPVASGTVTVTLAVAGQPARAFQVDRPARVGIFIPTVVPKTAGSCTLTVTLASESLNEAFNIEPCVVHADEASAKRAVGDDSEPPGQIGFLKEQQWPIDFATVGATVRDFTPSATINAQVKAVPGRAAKLTASTGGRLVLASPLPSLGASIKKGQVLARIQPTVSAAGNIGALRADVTAAQAERKAAQVAKERLERLVASDSVPKRRLDEAVAALDIASARLSAAKTRLASYQASAGGAARATAGAFRIRSPIAGTLVEQNVTEGQTVEAGALLFAVIDLDRVWVEGRAFEPDVPTFERAENAWFTVDGRASVFDIGEGSGRLVTVGHVLDPKSRTVPVLYEVKNPNGQLRIGQFARLSVATGPSVKSLVIPESALIQDGAQSIVFVHVSGEAFARRVVRLGSRSRGLVEVRAGLEEGERVVTVGAYDVKLAASAGGAAAHGHAH